MIDIGIKLVENGKMPEFKTAGAVCADCYSNQDFTINPNKSALIKLGFAIELPEGYEGVIRPRSGLSKKDIEVRVGSIDWDYRGEVCANVYNHSDKDFVIHNGDRICQIAIREVPKVHFVIKEELSDTVRGEGGFGHTGV